MKEFEGITAELYRAIVAIVDDRLKEIRLTRESFDKLAQAVSGLSERMDRVEAALERLTEAQARTDTAVRELAQAQQRTEQRLNELTEAQARTEERVGRLEIAMAELAQAQARTEERVGRLEAALAELAQAQARTEERLGRLEVAMGELTTQVKALSDNVGYGLEDIARTVLPGYLRYQYGLEIERLERRFFSVDGQTIEIDLYGEGRRGRKAITLVGEVKARIYAREVTQFQKRLEALRPQLPAEAVPLLFGYYIDPSATEAAGPHVLLVASYEPTVELQRIRRRRRS